MIDNAKVRAARHAAALWSQRMKYFGDRLDQMADIGVPDLRVYMEKSEPERMAYLLQDADILDLFDEHTLWDWAREHVEEIAEKYGYVARDLVEKFKTKEELDA